jgi:hypothetical protein
MRSMTGRPPVIEVIDDEMAKVIRTKTGAERLQIASDMYARARKMLLSYLRAQHPDWEERRIQQEASRRLSHRSYTDSFIEHIQRSALRELKSP